MLTATVKDRATLTVDEAELKSTVGTPSNTENAKLEIAALRTENERLRRRLRNRNIILRAQTRLAVTIGDFGLLVVIGPKLALAIQTWLEVYKENPRALPIPETASVCAAIVRRFVTVGVIALSITMLPILLLYQQNQLITNQNVKLDTQSHLIEAQRRAGLMFEFTSILEEVEKTPCPVG